MTDPVIIACPECEKPLRIRVELEGKKVRCKDCGHMFTVKLPSIGKAVEPKKAPPPKQAAAPKKAIPQPAARHAGKAIDDDEYENPNPYNVTHEELGHRCPHCANEMESEDATVCLNCGYNCETREHIKIVRTIENTGQDQFLWLLPGILCVLAIFALIALDLVWCLVLPDLVEETGFPFEYLGYKPVIVWAVIFSLFGMFFAAKFAIIRLILNPTCPEQVKSN